MRCQAKLVRADLLMYRRYFALGYVTVVCLKRWAKLGQLRLVLLVGVEIQTEPFEKIVEMDAHYSGCWCEMERAGDFERRRDWRTLATLAYRDL